MDNKWSVRFISGVKDAAGNNVQITGLTTIFNVIAAAAQPGFRGNVADTTIDVINWNSGGLFSNNRPYPPEAIATGTCCTDDFIGVHIAELAIPEEDNYTFGVHSDDGFGLRIRGGVAISISGGGQIDTAAPEGIVYPYETGDSNTRAVYHLTKGVHRIEFFWWERGGGDNAELYAARGAYVNDRDTSDWRLVGDSSHSQNLISLGVDVNGWTAIASDPGWPEQVTNWDIAKTALSLSGGADMNYDALNIGDPDTNPGADAFPKNTPLDDDDYAVRATATLVVPADGTYVIGFNSDDGGYVKIAGQQFGTILQNNTGASQIASDTVICDCLTPDSGTTATIPLTKGNYPIEAGYFERAGGSFLQVRGASAGTSPLFTYDLPILKRNGSGIPFKTAEPLHLAPATGSVQHVSVALQPGFNLIGNPYRTGGDTLNEVLVNVAAGTIVFKYLKDSGNYTSAVYFDGLGWVPSFQVPAGMGFWVKTKNATAIQFSGQVISPFSVSITPGFNLLSSPRAGRLTTDLNYHPSDGDGVFLFDTSTQKFKTFIYEELDGAWTPQEPAIRLGEGFFLRTSFSSTWSFTQ